MTTWRKNEKDKNVFYYEKVNGLESLKNKVDFIFKEAEESAEKGIDFSFSINGFWFDVSLPWALSPKENRKLYLKIYLLDGVRTQICAEQYDFFEFECFYRLLEYCFSAINRYYSEIVEFIDIEQSDYILEQALKLEAEDIQKIIKEETI